MFIGSEQRDIVQMRNAYKLRLTFQIRTKSLGYMEVGGDRRWAN